MAIDTTGNLSARITQYLQTTTNVDTNEVIRLINDFLPAGETVDTLTQGISTGVFKRLGPNDVVTAKNEIVTTGLWSGNTGSLANFFTSSAQQVLSSSNYYTDVYSTNPSTDSSAAVQFSLAYGHVNGKGCPSLANDDYSTLATKATYTQYRNLLLEPTDTRFTVVTGSSAGTTDIDDIYVINVKRARYKEKLDPGNWQLTLTSASVTIDLIDDSGKKVSDVVGKAGRVFYLASGSLNLGSPSASLYSTSASNGQGYGLFYPDAGLFVINPAALSASFISAEPSKVVNANAKNQNLLLTLMQDGGDFQARSTENVSSNHYFIRVTNREFNFSNNPTFVTGSIGRFKNSTFEGDPKVYPTTIGLYNDANELMAVAKMSQPIKKSFDTEMHVKVKLDF